MKFKRKTKIVDDAETPPEAITANITHVLQEVEAEVEPVVEEIVDDEEKDESPTWAVHIDGLQIMEAGAVKFSAFTVGESRSGQMVVEFVAKSGVNSSLFGWLTKPVEKKIRMEIFDCEGERIERWEMNAVPVAIAADELSYECKSPWFTTLQLSVKDIKIT